MVGVEVTQAGAFWLEELPMGPENELSRNESRAILPLELFF
jgi:hypothetical protein